MSPQASRRFGCSATLWLSRRSQIELGYPAACCLAMIDWEQVHVPEFADLQKTQIHGVHNVHVTQAGVDARRRPYAPRTAPGC
jgi:hypothetical protein